MGKLRLGPGEREALTRGAGALGVELEPEAVERLTGYGALLDQWSAKTNLISCGTAGELVERHLLDSLAVLPLLPGHGGLIDLGSGAGLPGIPLAIVGTGGPVMLIESRRRRANFLRAVKRELGLDRVNVLEQRAEAGLPEAVLPGSAAVCRAVWSGQDIFSAAAPWLAEGGRLLWMRSEDEPGEASAAFEFVSVERYEIEPGSPRFVHVFERG